MLAEIENALIAKIKSLVGDHVRTVDSHPGTWTDETLRHLAAQTPGVFVLFDGGKDKDSSADVIMNGEWVVFIVTSHANGEKARRVGDGIELGAYQLIDILAPELQGFTAEQQARMQFVSMRNAFSFRIHSQGCAVYEIRYRMAMEFQRPSVDALANFVTYSASHDMGGEFQSNDLVTLDQ